MRFYKQLPAARLVAQQCGAGALARVSVETLLATSRVAMMRSKRVHIPQMFEVYGTLRSSAQADLMNLIKARLKFKPVEPCADPCTLTTFPIGHMFPRMTRPSVLELCAH